MTRSKRALRAIDLYSGVGGWALGLRMAGVKIIASFDRWAAANETNRANNHHISETVDVRKLPLKKIPRNIDIVVGSPPCTQFSYSNRGGNGDIEDGLKDIKKFLTIVKHVKPKFWAMENVPRVAHILEEELNAGGRLAQFANLGIKHYIVDMADYGLPQRRKRCIAGNFDYELVRSLGIGSRAPTLGKIVNALSKTDVIRDPLYGIKMSRSELVDHVTEDFLNDEELQINKARKQTHPVYNRMPFPDPLNRTSRTITAVCTRVSRESIVITDTLQKKKMRRLTIRERACLQGFPINYQFFAPTYGQKIRMVGNAIPPLFSFYLGQSFVGAKKDDAEEPSHAFKAFKKPTGLPKETPPDSPGSNYPWWRTFCFAIPSLRLNSGVRCELRNVRKAKGISWETAFVFGTSKSIYEFPHEAFKRRNTNYSKKLATEIERHLRDAATIVRQSDIPRMQDVWSHHGSGGAHPLVLLQKLSDIARKIVLTLASSERKTQNAFKQALQRNYGKRAKNLIGAGKLSENAAVTLASIWLGFAVNKEFSTQGVQTHPNKRKRSPQSIKVARN